MTTVTTKRLLNDTLNQSFHYIHETDIAGKRHCSREGDRVVGGEKIIVHGLFGCKAENI